jgi:hypothetical protein
MPVLPIALAALSLVWFSFIGAEQSSVVLYALIVPLIAAVVLAFLWKPIGPHKCKSVCARWINGLSALACLAVFVSVPLTHWPLRLAYKLSRPSFNSVAQSLQSGAKFQQPIRVGLFTIEKAEIYDMNGRICLWTDLNPSGKTGFTKCPPNDVPFNLWSMIELDQDWQFVSED